MDIGSADPARVPTAATPTFGRAAIATMFSRAIILASAAVTTLCLPLALDRHEVGLLFLAQLVIAGLALFGQLGFVYTIPAQLTKAAALGDFGRARSLIASITVLCACASTCAAVLAWGGLPLLAGTVGESDLADLVPVIAGMVPLAAFSGLLIETLRALHAIRAAAVLAVMGGLTTAAYLTVVIISGSRAGAQTVLLANLVGLSACVVAGAVVLRRSVWKWRAPSSDPVSARLLLESTLPNLSSTLVLFAVANLDMILLSSLAPVSEIAVYGLALRICTLLHIPLGVINAAFIPLAVEARAMGQDELLHRIVGRSSLVSGALAAAGYVLFATVGYQVMLRWSPSFSDTYTLVLILGLGKVVHACGGSAGVILMTWGDQARAMRLTLATGLVTLGGYIGGYLIAGLYGLALAAAVGEMLQTALFIRRVRSRFGVDPFVLCTLRLLANRTR